MARRKPAAGAPVRVVLLQPVKAGGQRHEPGAELELPADQAQALIAGASARAAGAHAPPQAEPEPEPEPEPDQA